MYAPLSSPYSPERYKVLAQEAANIVRPDGVIIIDSLSHAWYSEGEVLEIKDKIASQSNRNSYTAWSEAGSIQNNFINYILSLDCHTIVTMRSKMEYAMFENDKGNPVQRNDLEYEFDIVLNINRNHVATASKDTTFLDKFGAIITPERGTQLKN